MVAQDYDSFKSWCLTFFSHLKVLGRIDNYFEEGSYFVFVKTDSKSRVFLFPTLKDVDLSKIVDSSIIFTLNKKANLSFLLSNWKLFVSKNITLYFVNPELNQRWSVNARVHDFVVEDSSLKKSLSSLFSTVQEVL